MIYPVVVAAGTAAGGTTTTEEEEEGTTTTTTTNGNTWRRRFPRFTKRRTTWTCTDTKSRAECHAAFRTSISRVWVQGEVTKSIENGATLTVDDGTGRGTCIPTAREKLNEGRTCAHGVVGQEKSVFDARTCMEIADAKVRRSREQAGRWRFENFGTGYVRA